MATTETERPVGDDPVIEITEEQKFVDDGRCGDTKVVPSHSESFVKQHVIPLKIMRQDIGHISYRKSVLVYPVTLADLQEPGLLKHIKESQQFKISFIDRLQEHNTKGFLSLRYRTMGEADKAVESLKKWREDLVVRSKLSHDCTNRVLCEIRGNGPTGETQYMVFVRFLPEDVTEEALDELIPGSISVDIATNFKGEYRDYAYLTFKSQEQAKEVAEKYKDVEMGGKKLLVVHYGTYVEAQMKPEAITEALPDDKRIELLQQFQEMKTTFDEQSSSPTLTKNERKHLRNKLDMVRARIKKDTKMRVKENKSILDIENIPGLKADPPEKTGNNMGDNSGNNMGNNKGNNTSDNQGNKTSENTGNSTVDVQPLSKKQRQNKRKHAEMAAAQAQRQPNQQQGVVGPGTNGMPDAGMNFLPNLTATAMNMLVGFLSNQLGQQMPQLQQQLPQLQEQMQLQQFHQQQQQKFPQQQQQKKQQFQQKQQPQQQQQQQQQQKQQQFQQQQMPMTEQELKKQERNRLKLQKRRQWQKIKRREKKLLQQGTGGADGAAPSTSTAGVSPSNSGADYNNGGAHNNTNLYGTAGYYDNKPCDLGFRDNNGGMCQSNFLDDDNTGTGGFYSNTQWQQGSAPAGGYGSFVSSGTISPGNYGNSLSQENSYNLGAGYNLGSNTRFPGNSYHDNLGTDGNPGDQGSWKNKGGRRKGNNKKKRIS